MGDICESGEGFLHSLFHSVSLSLCCLSTACQFEMCAPPNLIGFLPVPPFGQIGAGEFSKPHFQKRGAKFTTLLSCSASDFCVEISFILFNHKHPAFGAVCALRAVLKSIFYNCSVKKSIKKHFFTIPAKLHVSSVFLVNVWSFSLI